MKIIFIRHGESEGNRFGLVQGHLDFHLSTEGRGQAKKSADEIRRFIGDKKPMVFSSDLVRSWETAMIICEELKLNNPIPDRRLRERNMGKFQNLHWTTVDWDTINSKVPCIRNAAAHVFNLKRFPLEPYTRGAINEFVKQKKLGGKVK